MSYGGRRYGGGAYGGGLAEDASTTDVEPALSVEVAWTTGALETPVWENITADVREWNTIAGRRRELERYQPGRATIALNNRLRRYDNQAGEPAQYIDLPGMTGNYISTPDSAAISITGDIDIRVRVAMDDWTPSSPQRYVGKEFTAQRSYGIGINATPRLVFRYSVDGSTALENGATAATGFTDGTTHWLKITRTASSGIIKFYTAADVDTTDTGTITFAQLGADVSGTAGSLFDGNSILEIGSRFVGSSEPLAGNVYYAEVRDGIDGPVVAKFDANTVPQTGTRVPSSWTSETGEVWTVNGSAWAWGGTWGSPYAGNIRPMRRVRIRETFNSVTYPIFDGYADRWILDYPAFGKDATATIIATDGTKIVARTDLPPSVYYLTVDGDTPDWWWRLDENRDRVENDSVLNWGTAGTAGDAPFVGSPQMGGRPLIVNDPGGSMENYSAQTRDGWAISGADLPSDLNLLALINARTPFTLECWAQPFEGVGFVGHIFYQAVTPSTVEARLSWFNNPGTNTGTFSLFTVGATTNITINGSANSHPPGFVYHVVATFSPDGAGGMNAELFVDGASVGTDNLTGTFGSTSLAYSGLGHSDDADENFPGALSNAAVYLSAPLSTADIAAHHAAGTHPWQDDNPHERIGRCLDLCSWPAAMRDLDATSRPLQSADIDGHKALEHIIGAAESDLGLFLFGPEGNARLISRDTQAVRQPGPEIFGDDLAGGEVGYRVFKPDDGDVVIRNVAKISRLNGVRKTSADDTSILDYGPFDFTKDGLLHRSDAWSEAMGEWIVREYKDPRRRVAELGLGPPVVGKESELYPLMLGRLIGEAVTVRNRPLPGGYTFEQVCVIEGIEHRWTPKRRETRWALSPEFTEAPVIWQDYTPSNTNVTVGNGSQVARYAQIGKTVFVSYMLAWGSTTAFSGTPSIGLPVAARSGVQYVGVARYFDSGTTVYTGHGRPSGSSAAMASDNVSSGAVNATSPFTWTTNDVLVFTCVYEAA